MENYSYEIYEAIIFFFIIFCWEVNIANCLCLTKYTDTNNFEYEKCIDTNSDIHAWIISEKTPAFKCFKNDKIVLNHLNFRGHYRVLKNN